MVFENKKITFIFAHLDDETILSYGTIMKLVKNNKISILVLSGLGRNKDICKDMQSQNYRLQTFKTLWKNFEYKLCNNNDVSMSKRYVKNEIDGWMNITKPNIVFTHSTTDLHFEHRLIAEEVLVVARRKQHQTISQLYQTASPTFLQAYNKFGVFQPNYFVDITEYASAKKVALKKYSMEIPNDINDIRSAESILAQNRQYGRLMNVGYCEAFQQIFRID